MPTQYTSVFALVMRWSCIKYSEYIIYKIKKWQYDYEMPQTTDQQVNPWHQEDTHRQAKTHA